MFLVPFSNGYKTNPFYKKSCYERENSRRVVFEEQYSVLKACGLKYFVGNLSLSLTYL
jgi:hypothetical protein